MQRNIITTIKFGINQVSITTLETLSTNVVELFNATSHTKKTHDFLVHSLKEIEVIVAGKVQEVVVLIEPTMGTKASIELTKEKMQIPGNEITKQDITNILDLAKSKVETSEKKVILMQPIEFRVFDIMTKSYSSAPINKKGSSLEILLSVTTVSKDMIIFINQTVKSHGLKISQILLSPQAIAQNNISDGALKKGSVLVHFGSNQTSVVINKNLSSIAIFNIYNFGHKRLIDGVAKVFGISKTKAAELLTVHGSLDDITNRVIYNHQDGLSEKTFLTDDLQKIIKAYFEKLLVIINKFISQKQLLDLPVIFTGKVTGFEGLNEFSKQYLDSTFISTYNPISYVERNNDNIEALGSLNFINRMDQVLGKKFNTIVETNPHSITRLLNTKVKTKNWFARLSNKIGEKYDWN